MEIQYKSLHYHLPSAVTERVQKRLQGVKKYLGRGDQTTRAYVELGREVGSHQTGRIWIARINVMYEGALYRAEALEENIESAIDQATSEVAKELRRSKKKGESLLRRGGLFFKNHSQQNA